MQGQLQIQQASAQPQPVTSDASPLLAQQLSGGGHQESHQRQQQQQQATTAGGGEDMENLESVQNDLGDLGMADEDILGLGDDFDIMEFADALDDNDDGGGGGILDDLEAEDEAQKKEESEKTKNEDDVHEKNATSSVNEKVPTSAGGSMAMPKQPPPPPYITSGGAVSGGTCQETQQQHQQQEQQQDQQGQMRGPPPPYPGGLTGANGAGQAQQQGQNKPVSTRYICLRSSDCLIALANNFSFLLLILAYPSVAKQILELSSATEVTAALVPIVAICAPIALRSFDPILKTLPPTTLPQLPPPPRQAPPRRPLLVQVG